MSDITSDLLAELQADRIQWRIESDADEVLAVFWRGRKDDCCPDQFTPTKFYGFTLDDVVNRAHRLLHTPPPCVNGQINTREGRCPDTCTPGNECDRWAPCPGCTTNTRST